MIPSAEQYDLYISFNWRDRDWARMLADRLAQEKYQGRPLRVFIMDDNVQVGQDIRATLEQAMRASRAVAFVLSPEATKSEWVNWELSLAKSLHLSLFPLYRHSTELPKPLRDVFYLDFRNDARFEEQYRKLVLALCGASAEEYHVAQARSQPDTLFALWSVWIRFCTRPSDFAHHFAEFPIEPILEKLELDGLIVRDGEEIILTESGIRAASMLGEPEIRNFERARLAEEVRVRFQQPRDLTEEAFVERSFIEQLARMGWQHIQGDKWNPKITERENFSEVLLKRRLRDALRRINRDDQGNEWLDESRIERAMQALERVGAGAQLMKANEQATELLLKGCAVPGDPVRHSGKDVTLRYIDYEHPERNDFLVINQFRVDEPGGLKFDVPDIVLFVNGIPLVVIECKSPASTNPMEEGITQLLRYSNQRGTEEGIETLFYFNQFLVSTYYYQARVGTVGASFEHYLEWKDTAPVPMSQVAAELGVEKLTSQQTLIAGMLRPAHLLDLVRSFIVFQQDEGRLIKIIAHYHQFRA